MSCNESDSCSKLVQNYEMNSVKTQVLCRNQKSYRIGLFYIPSSLLFFRNLLVSSQHTIISNNVLFSLFNTGTLISLNLNSNYNEVVSKV